VKMLTWLNLHTDTAVFFVTALFIMVAAIVFGSW
jgi:hypothetical protein